MAEQKIGKLLLFNLDTPKAGGFGPIFSGKFEETITVNIHKIPKQEFSVDLNLIRRVQSHSNVMGYYCAEQDPDYMYLAYEPSAGTLKDLIGGHYKGPEIGHKPKLLRQIGKGLEYLHEKKIIHCRLKPSMICISYPDGTVSAKLKLAYFGRIGRLSKSWTAPEINRGSRFTFQMDIFSLGCLYGYILSHGCHIFGDNKEERIARIQDSQPIVLSAQQLQNNITLEMAVVILDLIRSMVSTETKERPSISAVLAHSFLTEAKKMDSIACQTESDEQIEEKNSNSRKRTALESFEDPLLADIPKKVRMEQLDLWSFLDEAFEEASKVPSTNNGNSEEDEGCILSQSVNTDSRDQVVDHHPSIFMRPSDFTDLQQYGSYVRDTICWGMRVRYCGNNATNGKVEYGDIGKVLRLHRQFLDSLNVEVHWQRNASRFYGWVRYCEVEILGEPYDHTLISFDEALDATQTSQLTMEIEDSLENSKKEEISNPVIYQTTIDGEGLLIPPGEEPVEEEESSSSSSDCSGSSSSSSDSSSSSSSSSDSSSDSSDAEEPACTSEPVAAPLKPPEAPVLNQEPLVDNVPSSSIVDSINLDVEYEGEVDSTDDSYSNSADENDINFPMLTHPGGIELVKLCKRNGLNSIATARFHQLVANQNVDINLQESKRSQIFSPILLLCRNNRSQTLYPCLKAMLKRQDIDLEFKDSKFGNNALTLLSRNYDHYNLINCVRLLINAGISVNSQDFKGRNSLVLLSRYYSKDNLMDLFQLLVQHGIDVKATQTDNGWDALVTLCCFYYKRENLTDLVRFLLENGASNESSALIVLCANSHKHRQNNNLAHVIGLLLDHGFSVNKSTEEGETALMLICSKYDGDNLMEVVRLLISSGADIAAKSKAGLKAVDILARRNITKYSKVVQLLS